LRHEKTLGRLALLTLLDSPVFNARAQSASRPAPTAAELRGFFDRLAETNEGEGGVLDSLTLMSRRLVTYLKSHAATGDLGVEISAESADKGHLKVLTYSYPSGARGARFIAQYCSCKM